MTTIVVTTAQADTYRALTVHKEYTRRTTGKDLDALASQLADDKSCTLVNALSLELKFEIENLGVGGSIPSPAIVKNKGRPS
jgi:hypothetical protein